MPMIAHADFSFHHTHSLEREGDNALLVDTLAQMCVSTVFKMKMQIAWCLALPTPSKTTLWKQIEEQVDSWFSQFMQLVKSQALDVLVCRCLCIQ
ncbi:hypothetical protein H2198_007135 [Neophaeococcomyces mojaviensis]|uniref:Uncharacterized protein n=1 Tax=Neophaeococcomyces mojaviensis TaxID=3383035 RepID=A0ACC3A112_9EURO|nr:hypothetical protein H2198_007135 [Knufia sp. JES_112]